MGEIINYLTPILIVVLGFLLNKKLGLFRSENDFLSLVKAEQYKALVDYYDNKLRHFLNPLLICIEFDNSIWKNLSMLSDSEDVFPDKISADIEKEHLLSNLSKASTLTRENLHLVKLDSDLHKKLIEFIRHVAIYQSIRNTGESLNPIEVNAPFPKGLEELVRQEYVVTIKEYECLIKSPNKAISLGRSASLRAGE